MDRDPAHLLARVAADYQIPPTAPQGDVRLASFGLGELVERTTFDRLQIEPAYGPAIAPEYGFYGEWGGPFWYDPLYPEAFSRPWFGGAVILRAPSWRHWR